MSLNFLPKKTREKLYDLLNLNKERLAFLCTVSIAVLIMSYTYNRSVSGSATSQSSNNYSTQPKPQHEHLPKPISPENTTNFSKHTNKVDEPISLNTNLNPKEEHTRLNEKLSQIDFSGFHTNAVNISIKQDSHHIATIQKNNTVIANALHKEKKEPKQELKEVSTYEKPEVTKAIRQENPKEVKIQEPKLEQLTNNKIHQIQPEIKILKVETPYKISEIPKVVIATTSLTKPEGCGNNLASQVKIDNKKEEMKLDNPERKKLASVENIPVSDERAQSKQPKPERENIYNNSEYKTKSSILSRVINENSQKMMESAYTLNHGISDILPDFYTCTKKMNDLTIQLMEAIATIDLREIYSIAENLINNRKNLSEKSSGRTFAIEYAISKALSTLKTKINKMIVTVDPQLIQSTLIEAGMPEKEAYELINAELEVYSSLSH